MEWAMADAARAIGGELIGGNPRFTRVGTDTRRLAPGSLFVALRGPNFDGHDHLDAARDADAAGALVQRALDHRLPRIRVDDSLRGLGRLAHAWRERRAGQLVAITASNGKTTMKEMLAAILRRQGPVHATRGNRNNEIGVPTTLLEWRDQPRAVIELGANHPGEIGYLSRIVAPDVALLGNAGRAHLAGFGDERGVATAKAEIVQGLRPGGHFLFPSDSRWSELWRVLAGDARVTTFGFDAAADVRVDPATIRIARGAEGFVTRFRLRAGARESEIALRLAGRHNVANALAAASVALALGLPLEAIREGLAGLPPVPGRLAPEALPGGGLLIDDSYNANPDSVRAAIEVLARLPGRRTLALGELGELGVAAPALHEGLGEAARDAGIERLFALGPLAARAASAFGPGGRRFDDHAALAAALRADLGGADVVLVKGSRSAAMERVAEALRGGAPT